MGLVSIVIYLAVGAFAGLISGLLGVGGGIVIVPVLIAVFGANQFPDSVLMHMAVGTSLGVIVLTSIASVRAHHRHGAIGWDLVKKMLVGIVLGAWFGAWLADLLTGVTLQRLFGGLAILVGAQFLSGWMPAQMGAPLGVVGQRLAGGVIGTVSALLGIGGGSMTVPFLIWKGYDARVAIATSAACGMPIALAGCLGFVVMGQGSDDLPSGSSGYLYWPALGGMTLSSVFVAPLGARLAHSLPVTTLKKIFALLLLAVGFKMVLL